MLILVLAVASNPPDIPGRLIRSLVGSLAIVESARCFENPCVRHCEVDPPDVNTTRSDLTETAQVRPAVFFFFFSTEQVDGS